MFAAAPAKQSVGETIAILSSRLGSATLLEDRRAAILGLRSFSKDYPASVASGALRSLIGSLGKDGEDVDTVKVVLETLLMLFSPNEDSPEASDEIALWLADEFTQRRDNIDLLLALLEGADFYARLYSLQLLAAVHSARPERTEECILAATTGVARVVALLDDGRDAVRNEAVALLTSLTPASPTIQQVVAFQGTFEKIFAIIAAEGGLYGGGRAVEDCLILLANLVRLNPSNQTLFRESGCISQLAFLLDRAYGTAADVDGAGRADLAPWAQSQRDRNVYALLAVVRLFLVAGSSGVSQNQSAFHRYNLLNNALQLAFNQDAQLQIRVEALSTCADVMRSNAMLQESFAQLLVPSPVQSPPSPGLVLKSGMANGVEKVFVIDGLLDLSLGPTVTHVFDLRYAACECLEAYFHGHNDVRLHFLSRAIEGHREGGDETTNILSLLLQPPLEAQAHHDPHRAWLAAVIMFHLVYGNPQAKAMAMAVTEGDASSGEEVVTSIQTIAAHLLAGLSRGGDEPVLTGYLMLLLGWLYEDMDAVNDFLCEGSNVQGLVQTVVRPVPVSSLDINRGLCAMLLGFVYEFSTKDSPVPRSTIHSIITSGLGKDVYVDRLKKLRSHPLMRDFEVTPQKLPDVYFDSLFVEFFKDNYSRAARAIEREPGLEISVANGVQRGISRDLVDSLREELAGKHRQVAEKELEVQEARVAADALRVQLAHENAARARAEGEVAQLRGSIRVLEQRAESDLAHVKRRAEAAVDNMSRQAGADLEKARQQAQAALDNARRQAESELDDTKRRAEADLESAKKQAETDMERAHRRTDAEKADLRATISRLEVDLMKANKARTHDLQTQKEEYEARLAEQAEKTEKAIAQEKAEAQRLLREQEVAIEERVATEKEAALRAAHAEEAMKRGTGDRDAAATAAKVGELEKKLAEEVERQKATQGELDDTLMVFGDLEEKVASYKARLVAAGQTVSEGEEDDDDDGDGDGGDSDEEEDEDEDARSGVD